MNTTTSTSSQPGAAIPADDPNRALTVSDPDGANMRHVSVVGDTYTILVSGAQTNGRYCLIDMLVPDCGGPPSHRHDFEEMFTLLEGELAFTFRGETQTVGAGSTVNVPANAPHVFKNKSGKTVHMLCLCAPAGQDEFFMAVGVPVESRTSPPPKLSKDEQAEKGSWRRRSRPHTGPKCCSHEAETAPSWDGRPRIRFRVKSESSCSIDPLTLRYDW